MPAHAAIIDAELTACDAAGMPDFSALLRNDPDYICVLCFALLALNGKDMRPLPYLERKGRLESLVNRSGDDQIGYSEPFDKPDVLLKACSRMKLGGIVSQPTNASYHSDPSKDWIKLKCQKWRAENEWRGDFFNKSK
jgi:bifunctional non-homologous end joining protein LigD